MADWDHNRDRSDAERNGRLNGPHDANASRDINNTGRSGQRPLPSENGQAPSPGQPQGYGDGGYSPFGQMASGSSDSGLGGYSGGDVGGYGQPNLNSQWGQGGYAPLNQGLDYGQGGSRFGPAGYGGNDFGGRSRQPHGPSESKAHNDQHLPSYHHWRETQLASHDNDYSRWRAEQTRRYDEDYGSWRNERHSAFSKEFEGWRAGRGGQAGTVGDITGGDRAAYGTNSAPRSRTVDDTPVDTNAPGSAHGANATLARIADGDTGHHHKHEDPK